MYYYILLLYITIKLLSYYCYYYYLRSAAAAADDDDDNYDYFCSSLIAIWSYITLCRIMAVLCIFWYSDPKGPWDQAVKTPNNLIEPGQDTWREILHQLVGKIPV